MAPGEPAGEGRANWCPYEEVKVCQLHAGHRGPHNVGRVPEPAPTSGDARERGRAIVEAWRVAQRNTRRTGRSWFEAVEDTYDDLVDRIADELPRAGAPGGEALAVALKEALMVSGTTAFARGWNAAVEEAYRFLSPPATAPGAPLLVSDAMLETLAEGVHTAYLETCARLGWSVSPANAVSYAELSDAAKELDRATVRAVLSAGGQRLAALEQERDDAENGCEILRGHYDNAIKGATHWRERAERLQAALKRAEGERDEALAAMASDGADAVRHNAVLRSRVAALEAALRRAGERLHSALMGDTTMTVHACHTFEATDTVSACPAHECVEARAALAPPERSRP